MTTADAPTKTVTWLERQIEAYEPSDEQFAAVIRLSKLPRSGDGVSVKRMLATMNRVPEMCRMLMADEDDREWLDDGIAFNRIKLTDLPDFLFAVITTWWASEEPNGNRTRRRAAKKTAARLAQ